MEISHHERPTLKERGYAAAEDDSVFGEFLTILGRRQADLRPGMRFRRQWDRAAIDHVGHELSVRVRAQSTPSFTEPAIPATPGRHSFRSRKALALSELGRSEADVGLLCYRPKERAINIEKVEREPI